MLKDEDIINKKLRLVTKDLLSFKNAFTIKHSTVDLKSKFNEKSNPREWISKFMKLLSNSHSSFIDDHISDDTKKFLKMVPQAKTNNELIICITQLYMEELSLLENKENAYERLIVVTKVIDKKLTKFFLEEFNLVILLEQINLDQKKEVVKIFDITTLHDLYEALLLNDKLHDSFIRLWFTTFEINELNEEFDYRAKTLEYPFLDWHCVVNEMTSEFMDLMGRYDEMPLNQTEFYRRKSELYRAMNYYTRLLKTKNLKPENIYFIIKFLSKQGPEALLSLKNISDEVKFFVPLENATLGFKFTVKSNMSNSLKLNKLYETALGEKRMRNK